MKWLKVTVIEGGGPMLLNSAQIVGIRPITFSNTTSFALLNGIVLETEESFENIVAMIESSGLNS